MIDDQPLSRVFQAFATMHGPDHDQLQFMFPRRLQNRRRELQVASVSFERGAESLDYEAVDANLRNAIINDPAPFTPFAFQMLPTRSPRQLGLVSGDEIPVRSVIDRHQARRMFFRWATGRDHRELDRHVITNSSSSSSSSDNNDGGNNDDNEAKPDAW
jgi:hypothetical protein